MEVWKAIKDYPNYEVSNYGNVKSLKRKEWCVKNNSFSIRKERILKPCFGSSGYLGVNLYKNGKCNFKNIHQLVAISFLNHTPCGYKLVVNHKNIIKSDNRLDNLEIVTARENSNLKHIKSSSQYTGVSWDKTYKKWTSQIHINKKDVKLGRFNTEEEANNAYQKALYELNKI
jgi:hypothetical protein